MADSPVFAVFEAVCEQQPASVTALVGATGKASSTVHRALLALQRAQWIQPAPGRGRRRWVVADRLPRLVGAGATAGLAARMQPVLDRIAAEAEDSAQLWVREGDGTVVAAAADAARALRVVQPPGTWAPLHAGAAGKAILAEGPDGEVRRVAAAGLPPLTMRTVIDAELLLVDLRRTRDQGWAIEREEREDGVAAVGVALGPAAALTVTGPAERIVGRAEALAELLSQAASDG